MLRDMAKQSIDLYSSVPSPSLNFLGTPCLTRLGSSFLSSSLTKRHTPEILPTLSKPLLPPEADNQRYYPSDVFSDVFYCSLRAAWRMHRNLVRGFFKNASGMSRPNGEIHVSHKTKIPFCCWDIEECIIYCCKKID